jgi:ketosteroid isomerase-like protein
MDDETDAVAVVEALYAAMASRDFDRLFALVDPEVVVTQDPRLPWGGRFEGHDGLATFAAALTGAIDSQVEIESLFATDAEVVQCGRTRGTVRGTDVRFDIPEVHRWEIRAGRAVRAHFAIDTEAMLAALAAPAEACPECGFVWAAVPAATVAARVRAGSEAIVDTLRRAPDAAAMRPAPDVWSGLEYAAHVRDVMLNVRDRLVVGIAEDTPDFKPLYRDVRVDVGLYGGDDTDTVAAEVVMAADLFGRTFDRLTAEQLARPVRYAFPTLGLRTNAWMGQQVVHEVEHHLGDVTRGLAG